MKRTRKFLASLLALALCLSLLPGVAWAEDSGFTVVGGTSGTDYTLSDDTLTIKTSEPLTISGGTEDNPITGRIVIQSGTSANLTLAGVHIQGTEYTTAVDAKSAIELSSNSTLTLTLADSSNNTLKGGSGNDGSGANGLAAPGIHVPQGATLVVQCALIGDDGNHICNSSSNNCGKLAITGGAASAGIGGVGIGGGVPVLSTPGNYTGQPCGTVMLLGGNITVTGDSGSGTSTTMDIGGSQGTSSGGTGGTVIILTNVQNSSGSLNIGGGAQPGGNADNGVGIKPSSGGNTYEVYGSLSLPDNLTIPEGVTVTIPQNTTLTVPDRMTLTNNGTIVNNGTITVDSGGTLTNNGDVSGSGSLTNNGTVTKKQQTATAPTVNDVTTTETSITVKTVTGQKYAVTDTQTAPAVGADTWKDAIGDSLTFDSLTENTTYYIWTYKPAGDTRYYTDSPVSTALAVTTQAAVVAVTGVSLDKSELSLTVDDTATLTATVSPDNATDKTVTWGTDHSSVATVSNGVVTAVAPGEATITATAGGYTAACTVTVVPATTPVVPGDTVRYIVEHYKESGNNYFLVETEYPAGEIGKTVTAQPKDYPGYVYNAALSTASGTLTAIQGEGDILTLRLYYDEEPRPSRPGGSTTPSYAVSVEDAGHGAVTVSPSRAQAGDEVTVAVTPDEGYALDELTVTDKDGEAVPVTENRDGTFSFEMPASRVTIQAAFVPLAEAPEAPVTWTNPFTDVAPGAWYYDAVGYVYANSIMTGTTATTFSPDTTTTRAQLWTILARLNGQNVEGSSPWYAAAQAWAVSAGVSDGTDPDGAITREQLAAMLYRAAGSPAVSGNLLAYPDGNSVSPWAESAMLWATQNGIITGMEGLLAPQGNATRAQVAAMLTRAQ